MLQDQKAMPSVYLDACCLNRPFDDQSQDRIRLEAEAVILILQHIVSGEWQGIRSDVLTFEIRRTPDSFRRAWVEQLVSALRQHVVLDPKDIVRGKELAGSGFTAIDALHLACAERSQVDVFLTTDDQLLRCASRTESGLRVRVANPVQWLAEVMGP